MSVARSVISNGRFVVADSRQQGAGELDIGYAAQVVLNNGQIVYGALAVGSAASPGGEISTTSGDLTAVGTDDGAVGDTIESAVVNSGEISVVNNSVLNFEGSLNQSPSGSLNLGGSGAATTLEVFGAGLSVHGGSVTLSNSAMNLIGSNGAATTFSNASTLSGAGTLGDGWLAIQNAAGGVIDANDSIALTLVADTSTVAGGGAANSNAGLIEATGAGGLAVKGALLNNGVALAALASTLTFNGAHVAGSGVVKTRNQGEIALLGNSSITGAELVDITAGGLLTTSASDTSDEIEAQVVDQSVLRVVGNSTLVVDQHWNNSGIIQLVGANAIIEVATGQTWSLFGGGSVTLSAVSDGIVSQGAGARLDNVNDTISGAGAIGASNMTIENDANGVINAVGPGGLTLDSSAPNPTTGATGIVNNGLMESSSASGLTLATAATNNGILKVNSGAVLTADGAVHGQGLDAIAGSGYMEFKAADQNNVRFATGAAGTLKLDDSAEFSGEIWGFAAGDKIDLADFSYVAGQTTLDASNPNGGFGSLGGELILTNGSGDSAALYLNGAFDPAHLTAAHLAFTFTSDGQHGTLIALTSTR